MTLVNIFLRQWTIINLSELELTHNSRHRKHFESKDQLLHKRIQRISEQVLRKAFTSFHFKNEVKNKCVNLNYFGLR